MSRLVVRESEPPRLLRNATLDSYSDHRCQNLCATRNGITLSVRQQNEIVANYSYQNDLLNRFYNWLNRKGGVPKHPGTNLKMYDINTVHDNRVIVNFFDTDDSDIIPDTRPGWREGTRAEGGVGNRDKNKVIHISLYIDSTNVRNNRGIHITSDIIKDSRGGNGGIKVYLNIDYLSENVAGQDSDVYHEIAQCLAEYFENMVSCSGKTLGPQLEQMVNTGNNKRNTDTANALRKFADDLNNFNKFERLARKRGHEGSSTAWSRSTRRGGGTSKKIVLNLAKIEKIKERNIKLKKNITKNKNKIEKNKKKINELKVKIKKELIKQKNLQKEKLKKQKKIQKEKLKKEKEKEKKLKKLQLKKLKKTKKK